MKPHVHNTEEMAFAYNGNTCIRTALFMKEESYEDSVGQGTSHENKKL